MGAKKKAYEIASHMFDKGLEPSKIADLTGIKEKELVGLLNQ